MALTRLGLISALLKQPIHAALREPGAWAPGLGGTFQSWRWVSGSAAASARARRVRTELAPRSPDAPVLEQVHEALEPAVSGQLDLPAIAQVLQHRALVVTRPVEWGTVLLGFEQANRYTVLDEAGQVVAHLMEEEGSIGRAIGRQLLRTRRPFTATVLSPDGSEVLFRMRRPFYFINSSMFIEDGNGQVIGEVQQRWHLWRRNYDLYIERRQFAAIEAPLLAWDFELKDETGNTMALIDRNFQGFGKELFTDAGKYAIHFGSTPTQAAEELATAIQAQHPDRPPPSVTALARVRTDVAVIPTSTGNQLVVQRPLALGQRMIALAAAISIDYDYFSRHSTHGGGLLSPFIVPPMIPYPVPVGGGDAPPVAPEAGPAAEAGESGAGAYGSEAGQPAQGTHEAGQEPLERDLGSDDFWGGQEEDSAESLDEDGGGLFGALRDFFDDE